MARKERAEIFNLAGTMTEEEFDAWAEWCRVHLDVYCFRDDRDGIVYTATTHRDEQLMLGAARQITSARIARR